MKTLKIYNLAFTLYFDLGIWLISGWLLDTFCQLNAHIMLICCVQAFSVKKSSINQPMDGAKRGKKDTALHNACFLAYE